MDFEPIMSSFSSDLIECNAKNHFTEINFSLSANSEEEGNDVIIKLSMAYDKDMERPRNKSLQLEFEPEIDDETEEKLLEECRVFYKKSLVAALNNAFL